MTLPYTPEANGVAERLNRTLFERTRALMLDAQADKNLWGEAIMAVVHTANRSPTTDGKSTPYERFHGVKPDVSHLRDWGSLSFALKPDSGSAPTLGTPRTVTAFTSYRQYRGVHWSAATSWSTRRRSTNLPGRWGCLHSPPCQTIGSPMGRGQREAVQAGHLPGGCPTRMETSDPPHRQVTPRDRTSQSLPSPSRCLGTDVAGQRTTHPQPPAWPR